MQINIDKFVVAASMIAAFGIAAACTSSESSGTGGSGGSTATGGSAGAGTGGSAGSATGGSAGEGGAATGGAAGEGGAATGGAAGEGGAATGGAAGEGGAATGGAAGEGGAAGSGTGGSAGAASCDNNLDGCGDSSTGCTQCALAGVCATEYATCLANTECVQESLCYAQCDLTNTACLDACDAAHPNGIDDYTAVTMCVVCTGCPTDCNGAAWGCP